MTICKKRSMESDYQIPGITVFTWFVKMPNKTVFYKSNRICMHKVYLMVVYYRLTDVIE